MTFTVEIANAVDLVAQGHSVEIYIDKNCLKSLINRLTKLSELDQEGDHLHLMSESWGLGDLSETPHADGNLITHHLKIILI